MDIRDRIRLVIDQTPDANPTNVAISAGLSNSALHKFLDGQTRSMTLENVDKVAKALGVSARWLAYGDGPREPEQKVVYIWDRIADKHKDQALRVLESFVDDESKTAG